MVAMVLYSKLGSVSLGHEILIRNDRRANSGSLLGPSIGAFPSHHDAPRVVVTNGMGDPQPL